MFIGNKFLNTRGGLKIYMQRKDNKNRVLHTGEYQVKRNGNLIYMYKYTGRDRKPHYVYSPRLTRSDAMPEGARDKTALRDKVNRIKRDLNNRLIPCGGGNTVLKLVEKYVSQRNNVKENTKKGYNSVVNRLKKCSFGKMRIEEVLTSDAKEWLRQLQEKEGLSYSTICSIKGVLKPAFQMAVGDALIYINPFNFNVTDVIINNSNAVEAITPVQQKSLLDFIKNDRHYSKYYEGIYILFNTGLRISEFAGLTISDINFNEGYITVNKQLQRRTVEDTSKKNGKRTEYYIEQTKTKHGNRKVPMNDGVKQCFKIIIQRCKENKIQKIIDGYHGFLYFNTKNMPLLAMDWEHYFQNICKRYNKEHKGEDLKVTPHVCRHTFATNMAMAMAESGQNGQTGAKLLQEIMGHSDFSTTYNTYVHPSYGYIAEAMKKYVPVI